jgi:hypothetical protein
VVEMICDDDETTAIFDSFSEWEDCAGYVHDRIFEDSEESYYNTLKNRVSLNMVKLKQQLDENGVGVFDSCRVCGFEFGHVVTVIDTHFNFSRGQRELMSVCD